VYRNWVRYGESVARWLERFPREQVHLVVFDDFARDTRTELRRVLEFLEVDAGYEPRSLNARRESHRRRGGLLRKLIGSPVSRTLAHGLMPRLLGRRRASNLVWRFRQSRFNRRAYQRVPLPDAVRERLERELMPEVSRASELLGRDLAELWFPAGAHVG
jgi:hypothetical protein